MIGAKTVLRVGDDAALERLASNCAAKVGGFPVRSTTPIVAYVNHGRWIADCSCGGGVSCDPGLSVAVCFAHQTDDQALVAVIVHTQIVFPEYRAGIEQRLKRRTRLQNRNWSPTETVDDLDRENAAHQIGE